VAPTASGACCPVWCPVCADNVQLGSVVRKQDLRCSPTRILRKKRSCSAHHAPCTVDSKAANEYKKAGKVELEDWIIVKSAKQHFYRARQKSVTSYIVATGSTFENYPMGSDLAQKLTDQKTNTAVAFDTRKEPAISFAYYKPMKFSYVSIYRSKMEHPRRVLRAFRVECNAGAGWSIVAEFPDLLKNSDWVKSFGMRRLRLDKPCVAKQWRLSSMASCSERIYISEVLFSSSSHGEQLADESPSDHDIGGWCMIHQMMPLKDSWVETSKRWNWRTPGDIWSPGQKLLSFCPTFGLVPCGSETSAQVLLQDVKVQRLPGRKTFNPRKTGIKMWLASCEDGSCKPIANKQGTQSWWQWGNSNVFGGGKGTKSRTRQNIWSSLVHMNCDVLKAPQNVTLFWSAEAMSDGRNCVNWGYGLDSKDGNYCAQNLIKGEIHMTMWYRPPGPRGVGQIGRIPCATPNLEHLHCHDFQGLAPKRQTSINNLQDDAELGRLDQHAKVHVWSKNAWMCHVQGTEASTNCPLQLATNTDVENQAEAHMHVKLGDAPVDASHQWHHPIWACKRASSSVGCDF